MSTETVTIDALGTQGDGIARTPDGNVHIPYALPGETVGIARKGDSGVMLSLLQPSPERVAPACRHFDPDGDACGGCSLQHLADEPYRAFKRSLVSQALKARGLDAAVDDVVACHPGERRRAVFSGRRTEKDFLLGFRRAGTHHIVPLEECPIASPGIIGRLDAIRAVGASLATNSQSFRLAVLETETGLDIAAEGVQAPGEKQRRAASETVLRLKGIARVSVNGEILLEKTRPLIDFGGVEVSPPPGSFTQATREAEAAMAALVLGHLSKARRVIDLFSGTGTFALRLARSAKVHAVEAEQKPLAALDRAARNTQGLKPVTVEKRDLFRRPVTMQELKQYDGAVFDPPRAGAEAQSRELARSGIKWLAAVSCNPATLSRDLATLTEGGYRIRAVTPIDQFLWSAHVEAVALLER